MSKKIITDFIKSKYNFYYQQIKNNNKKAILTILAIVLIAVIVILLAGNLHHKIHERIVHEFPVTTPWLQDVDIKKEYVALIKASQHIELRSMERGYLQDIYVDEGQMVKKGQKMFQIMPTFAKAEFEKAHAEYQLSKIEYDNTKILNQKNIVSKSELALAKAKLDKVEAEMNLAKAHLDFTMVKAPFDGVMDRFYSRLGSLIEEGELLTNISDNKIIWAYFNVSESDYLSYMRNKKDDEKTIVELLLANGEVFEHKGVIDILEGDFNNEIGNITFRASFENPEALLKHGETGSVILTKKFNDVLVIPQKATFEILDKRYVYVVNKNNQIHSKQIDIEDGVENLFIVKSGITIDDKILLEGLGKVTDGQKIKTFFQDKETVIKGLTLPVKAQLEELDIEENQHNN